MQPATAPNAAPRWRALRKGSDMSDFSKATAAVFKALIVLLGITFSCVIYSGPEKAVDNVFDVIALYTFFMMFLMRSEDTK